MRTVLNGFNGFRGAEIGGLCWFFSSGLSLDEALGEASGDHAPAEESPGFDLDGFTLNSFCEEDSSRVNMNCFRSNLFGDDFAMDLEKGGLQYSRSG